MSEASAKPQPGRARLSPSGLGGRLNALVDSAWFQNAIIALILINALVLGLETYGFSAQVQAALYQADMVIVYIFAAEILLKLIAKRGAFFKSGWNWFDVAVVSISFVPDAGAFSVLRALRVLRLFRLFSVIPQMRAVVEGFMRAIPGMGAIVLVLGVIFYVASVMAAKLFGHTQGGYFANLGESAYSLFQIMTLESWSMGIVRPILEDYPYAWIFFVVFIMMTTFAVLNLFIAVIVESLQQQHKAEGAAEAQAAHDERESLHQDLIALRREVSELKEMLAAQARAPHQGPER